MSMVLLIWKEKQDPVYWVVEKDKLDLAFLEMFKKVDEYEYYAELKEPRYRYYRDLVQRRLYKEAKEGNAKSARRLIELRAKDGYEYEEYDLEKVTVV